MTLNAHGEWELDDEIVAMAQALTGLKEKSSLVPEALKALIERESARGLAALAATSRRSSWRPATASAR
jgi:Arc/MetJ family transcription regulator